MPRATLANVDKLIAQAAKRTRRRPALRRLLIRRLSTLLEA